MPLREILYRGKRKDNGEWVYGYPMRDTAPCSAKARGACVCPHGGSVSVIIFWDDPFHEYDYEDVVPETMGEFTGLTDKNGAKIFQGDICDFSVFDFNDCDTQYRGVVVYSGSRFMLWKTAESEYCGADGGFDLDWVIGQDDEFEVVGNIHDNPELLEGGDAK